MDPNTHQEEVELEDEGLKKMDATEDPTSMHYAADSPKDEEDDAGVAKKDNDGENDDEDDPYAHFNFWERQSVRCAASPCTYFWVSFIIALVISVCGMIFGDFAVAADNAGWQSRGTTIANRHTQYLLIQEYQESLWADTNGFVWDDLIRNVQDGWETSDDDDEDRRRLTAADAVDTDNTASSTKNMAHFAFPENWSNSHEYLTNLGQGMQRALSSSTTSTKNAAVTLRTTTDNSQLEQQTAAFKSFVTPEQERRLASEWNSTEGTLLEGCDTSFYTTPRLYQETRLWPIFRLRGGATSFLEADVLQELCETEAQTQSFLEDSGLCETCSSDGGNKCLQPYSLVFYARMTVENGMTADMSCEDLAAAWKNEGHEEAHQTAWKECTNDLLTNYNLERDEMNLPDSCPYAFFHTILDETYQNTEQVTFTSSIFATKDDSMEDIYADVDQLAQGRQYVQGAYDSQHEDLVNLSTDDQLLIDMSLAVGSALVTCLAMMVHTKSPFLTLVGLAQIVLSFPVAFFFYTFIVGLDFFPFLNFIGIFVLFALGADDVFVAVDKWKNARLKNPDATTEEIAAMAFPDAAMAMLLTTTTTAVAFFGTAVCPVAPILCFAVFVGVMVVFDYILCCLLVFPALAIYDRADKARRCCCHINFSGCCKCCQKKKDGQDSDDIVEEAGEQSRDELNDELSGGKSAEMRRSMIDESVKFDESKQNSLIHRILTGYYNFLYRFRWPLLVICAGSLIWCCIVAAQIELPVSADVRLYDENDNQYEQNFVWRQNILFDVLEKKSGSTAHVIWGVKPADTGNQNDPKSWSQLVLDGSFVPSDPEVQSYLLDFCDTFYAEDFAAKPREEYVCPMNAFDSWLQEQASADEPSSAYTNYCGGATGVPLSEADFDSCIYNWGQESGDTRVLARQGKVAVIYFSFSSRVRFDSPFNALDDEWNLIQDWMDNYQATAPEGAKRAFFTSEDYWWYDTNGSMLQTAFTSAAIAMGAAAGIILFSSRSFVLTVFATVTVGYVLTAVTAILVAMGWTLGFIESILFAILIGVSVDFVIHFAHAYTALHGHSPKEDRTKNALMSMGPSILAAAFTTFAAACVMLFTVITFFTKFATILFLTITQALAGSFVVFLTMTVCLGPSDPTYLFDHVMAKCCPALCGKNFDIQGNDSTQLFRSSEIFPSRKKSNDLP